MTCSHNVNKAQTFCKSVQDQHVIQKHTPHYSDVLRSPSCALIDIATNIKCECLLQAHSLPRNKQTNKKEKENVSAIPLSGTNNTFNASGFVFTRMSATESFHVSEKNNRQLLITSLFFGTICVQCNGIMNDHSNTTFS